MDNVIVRYFGAAWCGPCKKYKPVIYIERGIEQEAWEKRHGYDITLDLKNYKEVKGLENNYILVPVQD